MQWNLLPKIYFVLSFVLAKIWLPLQLDKAFCFLVYFCCCCCCCCFSTQGLDVCQNAIETEFPKCFGKLQDKRSYVTNVIITNISCWYKLQVCGLLLLLPSTSTTHFLHSISNKEQPAISWESWKAFEQSWFLRALFMLLPPKCATQILCHK